MYQDRIAQAINNSDTATVALVEDLMRTEHDTLDHLTAAQFTRAARNAMAFAIELGLSGMLGEYCQPLGLAVPSLRV